jgi:riboflavin synthase
VATTRKIANYMFTGIVAGRARVARVVDQPPGKRLVIDFPPYAGDAELGESVALAGCCLTVVASEAPHLHFEAGPETLARTKLGALVASSEVNIERSLKLADRLGGHLVTGHIDGQGSLLERRDQGEWTTLWFSVPPELAPQLAAKGSIAIDGVSLTLVEVRDDRFSVALIPHTFAVTTLGSLKPGHAVNLETDLLAKYVARQLAWATRK